MHEAIQWFGQVIPRLLASGLLLGVAALCLSETYRLWIPGPWVISPFSFFEKGLESKTEGAPFAQQILAEVSIQNDLLRSTRLPYSKGTPTVDFGVSMPAVGLPELPHVALEDVEINIQGINLTSLLRSVSRWINPPREITGSVTSNETCSVQVLLKDSSNTPGKRPIVLRTAGHKSRETAISATGSQLLFTILRERCEREQSKILSGMSADTFAVYITLFKEYVDTISANIEDRITTEQYKDKMVLLASRVAELSSRSPNAPPILKLLILSDATSNKDASECRAHVQAFLSILPDDKDVLLIKSKLDAIDEQTPVALLESVGIEQSHTPDFMGEGKSPANVAAEKDSKLAEQRRWQRPIRPGISVGSTDQKNAGTICCLVRDNQGKVYVLSSEHVFTGKINSDVIQPGPLDGGTQKDRIGLISRRVATSKGIRNAVGAIASVDGTPWDSRPVATSAPIVELAVPQLGMAVKCLGRTSGTTQGRIKSIHLNIVIADADGKPQPYANLFEVEGLNGPFSSPGDSGAPIVTADGKYLVGMLYAGSDQYSYGVPIQPILTALDVTPILGEEHSP